MSRLVSRLYRDPADASTAVHHLISSGYKYNDVGVIARSESTARSVLGEKVEETVIQAVGENLVATRLVAPALTSGMGHTGSLAAALAEVLGVRDEAGEYFQFGLGLDGVVVVVQTEESKVTEVHAILGESAAAPRPVGVSGSGFEKSVRMSATNPVDATMTGDFRKY